MKKGFLKRFLCIMFAFIFMFAMTPSIEVSAKSKLYKNTVKRYKEILLNPTLFTNYTGEVATRFACIDINGDQIPELFVDSSEENTRSYYSLPKSAVVMNMFALNKSKAVVLQYGSWIYDLNWYYCKSKGTIMMERRDTKAMASMNGYCNYYYTIYKYKNGKFKYANIYIKRKYDNGKVEYYTRYNKKITAKKAKSICSKYMPTYKKIKYHTINTKNVNKYVK